MKIQKRKHRPQEFEGACTALKASLRACSQANTVPIQQAWLTCLLFSFPIIEIQSTVSALAEYGRLL